MQFEVVSSANKGSARAAVTRFWMAEWLSMALLHPKSQLLLLQVMASECALGCVSNAKRSMRNRQQDYGGGGGGGGGVILATAARLLARKVHESLLQPERKSRLALRIACSISRYARTGVR